MFMMLIAGLPWTLVLRLLFVEDLGLRLQGCCGFKGNDIATTSGVVISQQQAVVMVLAVVTYIVNMEDSARKLMLWQLFGF